MELPKEVRIGPRTYTVSFVSKEELLSDLDDEGAIGSSNHVHLRIKVWADMDQVMLRETLLHEVLHCCASIGASNIENFLRGKGKTDLLIFDYEEFYVEALDSNMLAFLRDNPEVVAWLCNKEE